MIADDLTLWITCHNINQGAQILSELLTSTINPWLKQNNFTFSLKKCTVFLLSTHPRDPWPIVNIDDHQLSPPKDPKQLRLLGVFFDRQLTMGHHVQHIINSCNNRLRYLARIANCIWGASQADLHKAYITHICSIMEYCGPVDFPTLKQKNLRKSKGKQLDSSLASSVVHQTLTPCLKLTSNHWKAGSDSPLPCKPKNIATYH